MALTQISTQGIKDGTITGSDLATNVDLVDNQKLRLGAGNDLQIYHDGTDSHVNNYTGTFYIQAANNLVLQNTSGDKYFIGREDAATELYYDNSKKFETTSYGALLTGQLYVTDYIYIDNQADLYLEDNGKARFGDGSDLEIFHDGSHSRIYNSTGNLTVRSAVFDVLNADGSERMMRATADGGCDLFFNGVSKLETRSGDTIFHDDIRIQDNNKINIGTGDDLQIFHNGTDSIIENSTNAFFIKSQASARTLTNAFIVNNFADNESIIDARADGSVSLFHDGSKKFETTANGVMVQNSSTNARINFNAASGTRGYVYADNANQIGFLDANAYDWLVKCTTDGAVELYHDGSTKFKTTANGFNTQGSGQVEVIIGSTNAGGAVLYLDGDSDGDASGGANYAYIFHNTAGALLIRNRVNQAIHFGTNDTERWYVYDAGHFVPAANNTYDIGTSSVRVRNIYTNDLNLSNEGGSNDVDGTWGSYTIQEGAEDLFLVNKRNGKKYKFNLTEVS